jgi:transcriptional regulator with XRE-family HTH domain
MGRGTRNGAGADELGITLDPVIRELYFERLRQGLSQSEVARQGGFHPSVVSTTERGVHSPRFDIVHAWAGVLDLRICVGDVERIPDAAATDGTQ